jgi:glycosyltransferase involved in cell wall biosynthesis
MKKLNVSVVIIAKDEEKKIARCLESIRWADEVIVVDGMSEDRTAEIARSFGARVVRHAFTGSFADDRNVGMDEARNEWVLTLDADDVVTEDFAAQLEEALAKREDAVAYKFRRKNFFLGHPMEHGGWHHYIPNLVKKGAVRFKGDIHEVPVFEGRMGTIEADIEHYPFDSVSQFIARQNRYTDIAARDLLEREGRLSEREIRRNMMSKSLKMFWKSYVRKQGYKDGFYGLVFAVLFAFINFMKWAKYWELTRRDP